VADPTLRVLSCGGLGDTLLATPALRAVKEQQNGRRIVVYCTRPEQCDLYRGNPYIDHIVPPGRLSRYERLTRTVLLRRPLVKDNYGVLMPSMFYERHATELIAKLFGVQLTDRRLLIFLTAEEEAEAQRLLAPHREPVIIHITSHFSSNQDWPFESWTALVRNNPQYTFVQVGLAREPLVPGAIDLKGKVSLRIAVALLKHARSFVGVDSFFANATNAVGTRGVALYGPSPPSIWGHPNNQNLYLGVPCAPCIDLLQSQTCPYGIECMSGLTVRQVEDALREQMARAPAHVVSAASAAL
jgi:ADP-heptose:LPS heptosyltransferase